MGQIVDTNHLEQRMNGGGINQHNHQCLTFESLAYLQTQLTIVLFFYLACRYLPLPHSELARLAATATAFEVVLSEIEYNSFGLLLL